MVIPRSETDSLFFQYDRKAARHYSSKAKAAKTEAVQTEEAARHYSSKAKAAKTEAVQTEEAARHYSSKAKSCEDRSCTDRGSCEAIPLEDQELRLLDNLKPGPYINGPEIVPQENIIWRDPWYVKYGWSFLRDEDVVDLMSDLE